MTARLAATIVVFVSAIAGCAPGSFDDEPRETTTFVRVDTTDPAARRQYDANVAFATSYTARCAIRDPDRPRVLVTGFGRFESAWNNASGRVVSALVPEARYPQTSAPRRGNVDPPEPQLSVGQRTVELPQVPGPVDVCAVISPVSWDLAATIVAKEVDAFRPSFVVMNGVSPHRELLLELGAINAAIVEHDGSNRLRPAASEGELYAPIIPDVAPSEHLRGSLLSWSAVRDQARGVLPRRGAASNDLLPFEDVVFAGYPRSSNTFVCNNLTYALGYLMDHPRERVRLLRASTPEAVAVDGVDVSLEGDFRLTPRVFVHWPAELADRPSAYPLAADALRAMLGTQLAASARGDLPTRGDNALAAPAFAGAR